MHDFKNILLAWGSSSWVMLAAVENEELITVMSAIVLPVVFFGIGKAIDVGIQVYFRRKG
ncbi:MAG: hypothetical protein WBD22_09060 [Pyrinomonadaceae bacterium]